MRCRRGTATAALALLSVVAVCAMCAPASSAASLGTFGARSVIYAGGSDLNGYPDLTQHTYAYAPSALQLSDGETAYYTCHQSLSNTTRVSDDVDVTVTKAGRQLWTRALAIGGQTVAGAPAYTALNACDPSVIALPTTYHGVKYSYLMLFTGNPRGAVSNADSVGMAVSKSPLSGWKVMPAPLIHEPLPSGYHAPFDTTYWGVGQPTAIPDPVVGDHDRAHRLIVCYSFNTYSKTSDWTGAKQVTERCREFDLANAGDPKGIYGPVTMERAGLRSVGAAAIGGGYFNMEMAIGDGTGSQTKYLYMDRTWDGWSHGGGSASELDRLPLSEFLPAPNARIWKPGGSWTPVAHVQPYAVAADHDAAPNVPVLITGHCFSAQPGLLHTPSGYLPDSRQPHLVVTIMDGFPNATPTAANAPAVASAAACSKKPAKSGDPNWSLFDSRLWNIPLNLN